ncbi:MAG: hypothetical protein ABI333_25510 [bacterium]
MPSRSALLLSCCLAVGCATERPTRERGAADASPSRLEVGGNPRPRPATLKAPVSLFEQGRERQVEAAWARRNGYTIIDFSDDYTPYPFTEQTPGHADRKPNTYRARYVDLANDRTDRDGRPLAAGRRNYLELYGIPPSFGAIARRFRDDQANQQCFAAVDRAAIDGLDRSIHYISGRKAERRFLRQAQSWDQEVKRLLRRHRLRDVAEAEARGLGTQAIRAQRLTAARVRAIRAAQKRLACEGLTRDHEPLRPGEVSWHHQKAMVRFEKKHMIYGWGHIWKETRSALARTPLENNHRTLLRALRERLATAIPVVEDGSVPLSFANAREAGHRDLVGTFAKALTQALGVQTPQKAWRFFEQRPASYFARRRVAIKLPPLPEYYGPHMDLRVVIDRGDVWYDYPYDAAGRPLPQPKSRGPRLTLYAYHRNRRLPLVRWATTIGSWRSEVHRGCHYWKYKNSEIGDRLWKFVVAGPVWIPPPGTPPRSLVARRLVQGRVKLVAREWELGPGYASAYGLVAALHTRELRRGGQLVDEDGGIRTHGSADYMSILGRHSHGCHRLHNHLAVRLITFLLRHRRHVRLGELPIRWRFGFQYQGKRIAFQRSHKGYYYRLEPPLPVQVTRGRILGTAKKPIHRYIPKDGNKAGVKCPDDPAKAPAAGGTPRPVGGPIPGERRR